MTKLDGMARAADRLGDENIALRHRLAHIARRGLVVSHHM